MTTLLGDHICNIEEEEYWNACQHTLKSLYELRASDGDEEDGTAPTDDEDESDDKSESSSDNSSSDSGHDDDDSSTNSDDNSSRSYDSPNGGDDWDEPPIDKEDEDADLFYEEYDSDVDYYDHNIEDDVEANKWSDTDWSDITNVSSRSGLRYDKHGREVPELGSYYDSKPSSLTPHIEEEDNIDARLAALDQKPMVQSLRIMTLGNAERNEERMEESVPEHLPQPTDLGSRGKQDQFDEWINSIERLDAVVTTDMEVEEEEAIDYMDVDPTILIPREERAYWEPPTIMEATTELKNWAWERADHPMEDSVRKIKIVKTVTFAKKIKTAEIVTLAKNIVSVPIESISTRVSIPVKSVCDSFPVEYVESIEFVKNSFPFNMISDSAYLLALNGFIFEIGRKNS
ncbi:hypothetical protein SO802_034059 [Lithocarpus litseifolius]|uniref:Uncharacterized protein n=1 Tax=Lithocarpus litseifolius TaxID=425828 RepID=A0AAW2BEX5_9ROSI